MDIIYQNHHHPDLFFGETEEKGVGIRCEMTDIRDQSFTHHNRRLLGCAFRARVFQLRRNEEISV